MVDRGRSKWTIDECDSLHSLQIDSRAFNGHCIIFQTFRHSGDLPFSFLVAFFFDTVAHFGQRLASVSGIKARSKAKVPVPGMARQTFVVGKAAVARDAP